MLKWFQSLFAKPPQTPLPKPWPTESDVVREVVISLTDRPSEWSYSPPTEIIYDYGGDSFPECLFHSSRRCNVFANGEIRVRGRGTIVASEETVAALFSQHPAVVAAKERADEAAARPLADAIRSLRS